MGFAWGGSRPLPVREIGCERRSRGHRLSQGLPFSKVRQVERGCPLGLRSQKTATIGPLLCLPFKPLLPFVFQGISVLSGVHYNNSAAFTSDGYYFVGSLIRWFTKNSNGRDRVKKEGSIKVLSIIIYSGGCTCVSPIWFLNDRCYI